MRIDFQTDPSRYRHWRLTTAGPVATLAMDVDPAASLFPGCELKLNSYDLGVDIELADAVQRLRFEHPEVRAVVLRSAKPGVFCAGANIRMLAAASHGHKVNFCKFTNETRLAIEDASEQSGQTWLAALHAAAAGGGYELALACAHIMLIDDRRAAVSLPEVPLLGVLPATGGLTRLTDKRQVRRDRADLFCTTEEGVRGARARDWRLVDELVPPSRWDAAVTARAAALASGSDRPAEARGIALPPLDRGFAPDAVTYPHLHVALDRPGRRAVLTLHGPTPHGAPLQGAHLQGAHLQGAGTLPADLPGLHAAGAAFWPLAAARELDDAILHLRSNEPGLGLWVLRTEGDPAAVLAADALLETHAADWLVREIRLYWKRVLKRLDVTSRSLIALIEPGSCFAGTLAELAFAADRSAMHAGPGAGANCAPPALALSPLNFGAYPMGNGLTRLATRFLGEPDSVARARDTIGTALDSAAAEGLGLVTEAIDPVDWDTELRLLLEQRASFSPDALSALEANLRFAGPETMETRIFGRLSAWQNWVFQRPGAVGDAGALHRYGSGAKPVFDPERV
ncbi:MAG: 2,3-epoxybenzoyl-CoA dihydrolase [Proteobacteria bacterium]|nr:2,3-epoxybenzoyl-CoA dihydrolase [Pseudomonadota bacterium]